MSLKETYTYLLFKIVQREDSYTLAKVNNQSGVIRYMSNMIMYSPTSAQFEWSQNFFKARILSQRELQLLKTLIEW